VEHVSYPNQYRTQIWYYVVITTKAGDHVRLGAPVSRTIGEPEFNRQFRQIRASWQQATGITGTAEPMRFTFAYGTIWAAAAIVAQLLALIFVLCAWPYFAPAWAAHEGEGKRGVFTSSVSNCPQPGCSWFGTFTTAGSPVKYATLEPGGPYVFQAGQEVRAVDTGRKWIVYPAGGGTAWELPTVGVGAGSAVVLSLLAAELLVPVCRKQARHRRSALAQHQPASG
jgi:hypothetical protein